MIYYIIGYFVIGLIFALLPVVVDKGSFKYNDFYQSFVYKKNDSVCENTAVYNGITFIALILLWLVILVLYLGYMIIKYIGVAITAYNNKKTYF